jgi:predicted O-linked N-acetylglucosamine transferase (SPINDLY family)
MFKWIKKALAPAVPAATATTEAQEPDTAPDTSSGALAFQLLQQGQVEQAIQVISDAIAQHPQQADLLFYLGNLYHEQQRYDLAAASLRKALALHVEQSGTENADMLMNLGIVLFKADELDEASAVLQRALALNAGLINAHNTLGLICHRQEQYEHALTWYRQGLALDPSATLLHANCGYTLHALQRIDEAIVAYRAALALDQEVTDTWLNLGNAWQQQNQAAQAADCYRRALIVDPRHAQGWNNLGNILSESGAIDTPIACYQRAMTVDPGFADAWSNLGNMQMANGWFTQAVESFRTALQHDPDNIAACSNLLFTYNFLREVTPQKMLEQARIFGAMAQRRAKPYTTWANTPDKERVLRIGIVSGDLYNKAVGYFAEGVLCKLAAQSAGRLQLIAYHNHRMHDDLSERIKPSFTRWRVTVGLSDAQLAQQIRDDGIDILIDLSGHTVNNRLTMFAWKPAPVQISWLGYFATTGVAEIDYLVADEWTLPASLESHFSETIWRVPHTRLCFTEPVSDVVVSPLPALVNGTITFGCFNSLAKMTDEVVALWARVLNAVPNSRLFLKAAQLLTAGMQQQTLQRFSARGIAAERLVLEGPSPRAQYLAAYHRIDMALDPFPYTGGTTSAESLWMGVPVLTLSGDRFLSKQGIGLLMNAGLPEWIAEDEDDYIARAVAFSANPQALSTLRSNLRQRVTASPIFDAAAFAHSFEEALRAMWLKWCEAQ